MLFFNLPDDWKVVIATAADICLKPWQHSVVENNLVSSSSIEEELIDLTARIECRDHDGVRYPERDIEVEIFQSGEELNLTLTWICKVDSPILWQGQNSIWMNGATGTKCHPPKDAGDLESLGRRLRSLFSPE